MRGERTTTLLLSLLAAGLGVAALLAVSGGEAPANRALVGASSVGSIRFHTAVRLGVPGGYSRAGGDRAPGARLSAVGCLEAPGMARGAGERGIWHPGPTTAPWQWQLQGKVDTRVPACVFDVDGFETPAKTVRALHRRGARVVCYLDVGSWEKFRPDAGRFPRAVIGRRYEGFPNERWLDIARFHRFAPILEQRFRMCARKGFDAVEPDNVAGWENRTGFHLTAADQLRFNRWVARRVHALGMAVALKNDPRQVRPLLPSFDFAIVEECFRFRECGRYEPFVKAGKAVFETEYQLEPPAFCGHARALNFSAIRKSADLLAKPWRPCG